MGQGTREVTRGVKHDGADGDAWLAGLFAEPAQDTNGQVHLDLPGNDAAPRDPGDRRSLAYRLNLVLRLVEFDDGRATDYTLRSHRRFQESAAVVRGQREGSVLTREDIEALREGERFDVEDSELELLARGMNFPEWVLTRTPPPGQRFVVFSYGAGRGGRAVMTDDDSRAEWQGISDDTKRALVGWMKTLPTRPTRQDQSRPQLGRRAGGVGERREESFSEAFAAQ